MNKITITAAILLLAASSAGAETTYYKCQGERGTVIFSERPCGNDAQRETVRPTGAPGSAQGHADTWSRISADNAVREAQRALDRSEERAREIERERDRKIAELRERGRYANNNLAGAQYLESLATEMQAVSDQYASKLEREHRHQDRLRDQIQRTQDAAR